MKALLQKGVFISKWQQSILMLCCFLFLGTSLSAQDFKLKSLSSPKTSCTALGSSESITVNVENLGTADEDTIPVAYQVNSSTIVHDTIFSQVNASATQSFTFGTGADLSSKGIYSIKAWVNIAGDTVRANDTLIVEVGSKMDPVGGYIQPTALFMGKSSPGADTALVGDTLVWEMIPPTGYSNVDYGKTWDVALTFETANGIGATDTLSTAPTASSNGTFRFVATRNDADSLYIATLIFRDIFSGCTETLSGTVYILPLPDAGVTAILNPKTSCTALSSTENVTVRVKNFTSADLDTIPVAYQVNGGTVVVDTIFSSISTGNTYDFTFTTTADLSARGIYTIKAWTAIDDEANLNNDSFSVTIGSKMAPVGGYIQPTALFMGKSSPGADTAQVGDTLVWEMVPPTGYSNSDYGKTWDVALTFETANGFGADDTMSAAPTDSTKGTFRFVATTADADSLYYATLIFRDIFSGCTETLAGTVYVQMSDLEITELTSPVTACNNLSSASNVTIVVKNTGDVALGNIPVYYTINGGTHIWDTVKMVLAPDSSVTFTFSQAADLSATGSYVIETSAAHMYDAVKANNTIKETIVSRLRPRDVEMTEGTVFDGTRGDNTSTNPDEVCAGNTLTYEVLAPNGFTNSDYGTGWEITSFKIATVNGTKPTSFSTAMPTGSSPATLSFTAASAEADSLFVVELNVKLNSLGCDTTLYNYIQVHPTPVTNFSFGDNCAGQNIAFTNSSTISSGSVTYNWDFGDGSNSTFENPTHIYAKDGIYDVTLTTTSLFGCEHSVTKKITVYELPRSSFTYRKRCSYDSIPFTNTSTISKGTLTYLWMFGDASANSTDFEPNHKYAVAGEYEVTLVAISDKGCTDTFKNTITVHPIPTANFTSTTVCLNDATSFTDASTVSSGTITGYTWDFGDKSPLVYSKNPNHAFSAAGTYDVTLTVQTIFGCTNTITKKVTVNPLPEPEFTFSSTCKNEEITLNNTTTIAGGGTLTYLWSFGDGATSTDANPKHTFTENKLYKVKLIATSANGCKDSVEKTINIMSPTADFAVNDNCQSNTFYFNDKSVLVGSTTYAWYFGDGATSNISNPSHIYAASGKYLVKLVITSSKGCKDSATHEVEVYPVPVTDFTAANVCNGTAVSFVNATTNGGGTLSYSWNFGDGNTSTDENPSYTYSKAGIYKVVLNATNSNGCSKQIEKTVTVYEMPVAGFTATTVCQGNATQFTNASTGANLSYSWDFGNGQTSADASPTHNYANAGKYTVKLVVTNTNGCSNLVEKEIEVFATPDVDFSYTENVGTAKFNVTDSTLTEYSWDFGDGKTSTDVKPSHKYTENKTYTVTLTAKNANGCSKVVSKNIEIAHVGISERKAAVVNNITVYPNPARDNATIRYTLKSAGTVSLEVYDMLGNKVTSVVNSNQLAGEHQHTVSLANNTPGVYFIRINVNGETATAKIILSK